MARADFQWPGLKVGYIVHCINITMRQLSSYLCYHSDLHADLHVTAESPWGLVAHIDTTLPKHRSEYIEYVAREWVV